jgi:dTDP-3-amino-2,3,6-trideoxy-4-keto-D-glucose/dTDP-3-amino-3,4,6-trideoxy-alpha-D-glucose/dTDP-2,6-dideoxy-D-kanosamine transaminase
VKLVHLDAWNIEREHVASHYRTELPAEATPIQNTGEGVAHLFAVLCTGRNGLKRHLEAHSIQTKIHFPDPLNRLGTPWQSPPGSLPQVETWCRSVLSLPCYPGLPLESVDIICRHIREYYASH